MIKNTKPRIVSQLFADDNQKIYFKIPKYQRKYTWGINHWEVLFNDLIENSEGYFLGSVICVDLPKLSYSDPVVLEVIDGQQRMTSLSIVLTAIYSKLVKYKNELNEDELAELINIRKELTVINNDGKREPRLILQEQDSNKKDYDYLLFENGILDEKPDYALNAGNRRIYKAFKAFSKMIDEFLEADENEKIRCDLNDTSNAKVLLKLARRFNTAILVMIEVDNYKDAYMLFESLNYRGEPLTAVDLMKNLLIAEAERENNSENTYENWLNIQKNLGEDYAIQERFFRQYYNAFREEINKPFVKDDQSKKYPLAYLATKTTLMRIYNELIKKDYKKFLVDIKEAAKKYAIIINNESSEEYVKPEYYSELKDLERIQGAPSYLLLLYLELNKDNLVWEENNSNEELKKIIRLLANFFVRRNITDTPNTRDLQKIFMDLIEEIKVRNDISIYNIIRNKLISVSASDAKFEEKLKGPLYDLNDAATRYILCYIESQHQTLEIYTNLWGRDKSNKYVWTIEHIFPEGNNIPQCWVDMIAGGDRTKAYEYLDKYVHTLGNLTITAYNQTLSNKSFYDKMFRKNSNGKYVGYKNGLVLNRDVVKSTVKGVDDLQWTVERITKRTDSLVETAISLFKL